MSILNVCKDKVKKNQGITLTILIITIVIISIITSTVLVTASGYGKLKNLKKLSNDLRLLQENVNIYYEKNNALPIFELINEDVSSILGNNKNANDGVEYYKINLALLDNLNLNFGKEQDVNDFFIVNFNSHNVYYYAGIESNGVTYYGIKEIMIALNYPNISTNPNEFKIKTQLNVVARGRLFDIQLRVYTELPTTDIQGFRFKINNEDWTDYQSNNSYTFHNLERFTKYYISMSAKDINNNEIYSTDNELEVVIDALPINLTYDNKNVGTYNNPIIPAGFKPINENDALWQSSDGYKKGLVIEDAIKGNQFVWVPVDGNVVKFERVDFMNYGEWFNSCFETVSADVLTSIENNGGFYIARYEAGIVNNEVVSKAGVAPKNNLSWNDVKSKSENMYNNENYGATSTLIYGNQWDATLRFISAYGGDSSYVTNSTGKGNYQGTNGGDTTTDMPATCGLLSAFRQKNIYDMAGNVKEWTMENNYDTTYGVHRGGSYIDSGSPQTASSRGMKSKTSTDITIGFRVALYISIEDARRTDGSWNKIKEVNSPRLGEGMVPFYYDETTEVILTESSSKEEWNKWYDYTTSKWANAKTSDGSYWVWIPRYAYKITDKYQTSFEDVDQPNPYIDIIFVDNSNKNGDTQYSVPTNYETVNTNTNYYVHPAFINDSGNAYINGGWETDLSGIWVAKFEATNKNDNIVSLPNESVDWKDVSIGQIYTRALNYNLILKSHLMKNSEWGATAYLGNSKYGLNGKNIEINEICNTVPVGEGGTFKTLTQTGGGIFSEHETQSTTGNITGVYDMSGGTWEYTASYLANSNPNLTIYGSSFASTAANPASTQYVTVYRKGSSDSCYQNYDANFKKGDAIRETSSSGGLIDGSWFKDYSFFSDTSYSFFIFGGCWTNGTNAGLFAFNRNLGNNPNETFGFRVTLAVQ